MGKIQRGLVHIYTGDGKGKTIAALGLAVRAYGWGMKIGMFQFLKELKYPSGELRAAEKLHPELDIIRFNQRHPIFEKNKKSQAIMYYELVKSIYEGLTLAKNQMLSGKFDVIILDEILNAASQRFLKEEELIDFIKAKPKNVELILTGRGASAKLIRLADYVTIMGKIKHPYDKGIKARKGIEY